MPDVLLVNMPFSNLRTPSIALGLLKAGLIQSEVSCRVLNFNLRFAELIGLESYLPIEGQSYPEHLVGEWVFSRSLFEHSKSVDLNGYVDSVLRARRVDLPDEPVYEQHLVDLLTEAVLVARKGVNDFLDECLQAVIAHRPSIVGFTSVFQQHIASLSLARKIKSCRPDCAIIFGGSNCEGSMGAEAIRQFEFVDAVVSGEGDSVFPQLVESILSSKTIPDLQGVITRKRRPLPLSVEPPQNTPIIHDLDTLPIPDYDDYFAQLSESSLKLEKPILLFESSRGCWWGEKQHCTFCGLNGATMAYRSKSADRAFKEITHLTERYTGCDVNAVDNILDMKYFKTFITALSESKHDFGLFYEVKSNLKKSQLELLRDAGVKTIQPGIESLSDNVLKIMRKGVTTLQNVQFLKWCTELDLNACYNIIWGFPGETDDDYKKMSVLIPLITHLLPPVGTGNIRIDRFSPNFDKSRDLGFGPLVPFPAYEYVYPFEAKVLLKLAYFFSPAYEAAATATADVKGLSEQIKRWKKSHSQSDLFFIDKGETLLIFDFRPDAKQPIFVFDAYARSVYLACDEVRTSMQIMKSWREDAAEAPDQGRITGVLEDFVRQKLMISQADKYLSLACRKQV